MVRNSLKLVPWKDYKPVATDLKRIYQFVTEDELLELENFEKTWSSKYPQISRSWRNHRKKPKYYFNFSKDIRKTIYTTNTIESLI
ncbi:MAG: transposase [Methylococcaceae bacterium]|nr:transposase [Methylococcaceae bacterium]